MFSIIFVLIIAHLVSTYATKYRLKFKHNDVYAQIGFAELSNWDFFYTAKEFAIIADFMAKGKYRELRDPFLTWAGYTSIVSFITIVPLFIIFALHD